ncbi:zinc ribbon domain-containing protein [Streptomyces sp. NPDC058086]|uniref:zinc ribbon domain-containing protein n=1 Tax=Streptomyces sp. NPDC058086 TaxID=3346334 RepID=UPI0036E850B2
MRRMAAADSIDQRNRAVSPSAGVSKSRVLRGRVFSFCAIVHKARRAGVPLVFVDPACSSKEDADCGHVDRLNRISQAKFACRSCGGVAHAGRNASHVLARRGENVWTAGRESRVPAITSATTSDLARTVPGQIDARTRNRHLPQRTHRPADYSFSSPNRAPDDRSGGTIFRATEGISAETVKTA